MPTVAVKELRQKFGLLLKHGPDSNWERLAGRFGRPVGTVKFWGHGSARRDPDQMPGEAVSVLIDLFAAILPPSLAVEDLRRLIMGPAARLEEELCSAATWSLAAIIAREGKIGTALLVPKPDMNNLVEVEGGERPSKAASMRLGKPFRIEFPIGRAGAYAVALQHVQQVWAVVPSIVSDRGKQLLVPGRPDLFMAEHRDAGLNRFVCLQSSKPFPAGIDEHVREGSVLDKRAIEALAARYESVPVSQRSCHLLDIVFEARR